MCPRSLWLGRREAAPDIALGPDAEAQVDVVFAGLHRDARRIAGKIKEAACWVNARFVDLSLSIAASSVDTHSPAGFSSKIVFYNNP